MGLQALGKFSAVHHRTLQKANFQLGDINNVANIETSIDVLPSKNQGLCEYCTYVSNCLNIVDILINLFTFL